MFLKQNKRKLPLARDEVQGASIVTRLHRRTPRRAFFDCGFRSRGERTRSTALERRTREGAPLRSVESRRPCYLKRPDTRGKNETRLRSTFTVERLPLCSALELLLMYAHLSNNKYA